MVVSRHCEEKAGLFTELRELVHAGDRAEFDTIVYAKDRAKDHTKDRAKDWARDRTEFDTIIYTKDRAKGRAKDHAKDSAKDRAEFDTIMYERGKLHPNTTNTARQAHPFLSLQFVMEKFKLTICNGKKLSLHCLYIMFVEVDVCFLSDYVFCKFETEGNVSVVPTRPRAVISTAVIFYTRWVL